jgi:hypothetical protein
MKLYALIMMTLIGSSTSIFSCERDLNRQEIYIGPDIYHISREKERGGEQKGNMFGVRLGYNRFKRYGWYIGEEVRYEKGTLKGDLPTGEKLHSHFTDCLVEGRLGYTFQQKNGFQISFTPFLGVGYANEKNNYTHSSPIPIHFKTHFNYGAIGFFSWAHYNRFELGLNFIARMPYEPKCEVSHDPDHHSVSQKIKERVQYRVELPLGYQIDFGNFKRCLRSSEGVVRLVSYYEYRNYGAHPNYPFDFMRTEFQIWGATLELVYRI